MIQTQNYITVCDFFFCTTDLITWKYFKAFYQVKTNTKLI